MTASEAENQAAAAAQARGEAAETRHMSNALAQQRTTTGSDFAIEAAATPDDVSVMNRPGFGRGSGYWVVASMAGVG
jgi:hypothetical protein